MQLTVAAWDDRIFSIALDGGETVDTLKAVLEAESGYAQARGLTSQKLVGLYRSLGGGWESASLPAAGEDAFDKDGPDMWKKQPKLPSENPPAPAEQETNG